MSETQIRSAAWSRPADAGSEHGWTPSDYAALVGLVRHCDDQLASSNRYHMTAIGALVPVFVLVMKVQVPLATLVALMLLGMALCVRWLTQSSKLNLEKLCWVRLARAVEAARMAEPVGPFLAQQEFFSMLPSQVSSRDTFIMRRVGTRRLYVVSIVLLAVALVAAAIAATTGNLP